MMFFRLALRPFSTQVAESASIDASKKFFKVKLCRGFIGLPDVYRKRAATLELKKRGQTSYVPVRPETMGAIIKMKELLKVELVDEKPEHANPVYPKGYQVVDNYMQKPLIDRE